MKVLLAALVVLLWTAAPASAVTTQCAGPGTAPTRNLDPKPGAPRVFAMQVKLDPAEVVTSAAYARGIECLLRRYVLPYRAKKRPNLVVFDEDMGLLTGAAGPRFASVRKLAANPASDTSCAGQPSPCRAISLLTRFGDLLRPERAYYGDKVKGLSAPFALSTDTIVRTFMQTMARAAKRHGLFIVASNDQAPFKRTKAKKAVAELAPKGAKSAYVATSTKVYNSVFLWGPKGRVLVENRKLPLTPIEQAINLTPGPATAKNLKPFTLPGTKARLGFATSLPAFHYGAEGTEPCDAIATTYMRCLDSLGANVVIQADANPGAWTGADGDGIEKWQPLSWMTSTWRAVADPSVRFAYNVTPMLTGNLADLTFDGQSAITQRGGTTGPGCHYVGNAAFDADQDRPDLSDEAGDKTEFLGIAPWVTADGSRDDLRAASARLDPLSGDPMSGSYVETAVIADLPFPVDTSRKGCA